MKEIKTKEAVDEQELQLAQDEAKDAKSTFTHKFKKPFLYDGKEYESLTFDFESLSGNDTLQIERELAKQGRTVIVPEFNGDYLAAMASKACTDEIGADAFDHMSLRDFNAIRGAARRFLLNVEQS